MTEFETPAPDEVQARLATLLGRPPMEAARLLGLHWLYQLLEQRTAWQKLDEVSSAHAQEHAHHLHKARVALRRLRAVFRAHGKVLDGVARPRTLRALARLGKATNARRDHDVQRAWLDAEHESFSPDVRAEAMTFHRRLEPHTSHTEIEEAFTRFLDPHVPRLLERLSCYSQVVTVGRDAERIAPYAHTLAQVLSKGRRRILRDLQQQPASSEDEHTHESLHRVRLQFKLHRALLAPVTELHPMLARLYALETRAQDRLGAMRDMHLLSVRASKARLPALAATAAAQSVAHARAFHEEWDGQRAAIADAFQAAIDALDTMSTEDVPSRDSVPMEIERKFLLRELPPEALAMPPLVIEQGWIPGATLRERLRRSTYPDGRVRYTRTVKLGPLAERIELEEDTGAAVFETMWPLTVSARIRKHRHVVRDGAVTWEIDAFLDRDLVLAEVELAHRDQRVAVPDWLAPFVVREVTGNAAYANSAMARPDVQEPVATADSA